MMRNDRRDLGHIEPLFFLVVARFGLGLGRRTGFGCLRGGLVRLLYFRFLRRRLLRSLLLLLLRRSFVFGGLLCN